MGTSWYGQASYTPGRASFVTGRITNTLRTFDGRQRQLRIVRSERLATRRLKSPLTNNFDRDQIFRRSVASSNINVTLVALRHLQSIMSASQAVLGVQCGRASELGGAGPMSFTSARLLWSRDRPSLELLWQGA